MFTETFRAMNTEITLMAEGMDTEVQHGFLEARSFIEASERRFTRFSEESELSQLNRAAGQWFNASADLYTLMEEARECYRRTKGLFDPSILPHLRRAGYTVSMDEIRMHGTVLADPEVLQTDVGFLGIDMDRETRSIRLPIGMQVDLGGIAKGWIAERAGAILMRHSRSCAVNAGGDMSLRGYPEDQDCWEVALEDPRDNNQDLAILRVREGAVATSSIARRTWIQGGERRHHLIDPRTGAPAETGWLCVTVMAPRATDAEVFAKAFLLAGEQEAAYLSRENPELTALGVDRSGKLVLLSGILEGLNVS